MRIVSFNCENLARYHPSELIEQLGRPDVVQPAFADARRGARGLRARLAKLMGRVVEASIGGERHGSDHAPIVLELRDL